MTRSKKHTSPNKRTQRSKRRAAKVGLSYVNDFSHGIERRRCGRGFSYILPSGRTLKSVRTKKRIKDLVIPPAWRDVWICPDACGHIQAKGRDDAGRTQYIYHDKWKTVSAATKFNRMQRFAEVLPRIRRRVRKDLNRKRLSRRRVLAAVTRLLDKVRLRVGNEASVHARGATTLESDHVELDGFHVSLDFPGKSHQRREVEFKDQKVAKVIDKCEELDGQYLFCYLDSDDQEQGVASTDVNEYLAEVAMEQITAKDFRTWWGSVTALETVADLDADASKSDRKSLSRSAAEEAAAVLGNTVAVCRKSYIHPGILSAAESGELPNMLAKLANVPVAEMTVDEVRFKELLPHLDFN